MQNLVRSKTIGVTGNGGWGTAGAGSGRDLLSNNGRISFCSAKATRLVPVQLSVISSVYMLHVPPVIFFFSLDTPHSFQQVSLISNAEGCTLCNTSNICAPFVRKATTLERNS